MQESSNSLYDVISQMPQNSHVTLSVFWIHYATVVQELLYDWEATEGVQFNWKI